jgi:hypothetical protein
VYDPSDEEIEKTEEFVDSWFDFTGIQQQDDEE